MVVFDQGDTESTCHSGTNLLQKTTIISEIFFRGCNQTFRKRDRSRGSIWKQSLINADYQLKCHRTPQPRYRQATGIDVFLKLFLQ